MEIINPDKNKFLYSLLFPLLFIAILWIIEIIKEVYHLNFIENFGIIPLKASGLLGIIFSPLIHSGYPHLYSNTIPIIITGTILFYFYNEIAYQVFFLVYFLTGIWVWLFARDASHIGASGLVYGFVSFIFFSGIIRRNNQLMALSLLMVFLYGSSIWGIFPHFFPQENISWESHLMGLIAGFILSVFFRKKGMQRIVYDWEFEEDDETDRESNLKIIYYRKEDEENKNISDEKE